MRPECRGPRCPEDPKCENECRYEAQDKLVDAALSRTDFERLWGRLGALLTAARPPVVPFAAMRALADKWESRGYRAALIAQLPHFQDRLCAILLHEQPNRIFATLVWNGAEWVCESDDTGLRTIMKAYLPERP